MYLTGIEYRHEVIDVLSIYQFGLLCVGHVVISGSCVFVRETKDLTFNGKPLADFSVLIDFLNSNADSIFNMMKWSNDSSINYCIVQPKWYDLKLKELLSFKELYVSCSAYDFEVADICNVAVYDNVSEIKFNHEYCYSLLKFFSSHPLRQSYIFYCKPDSVCDKYVEVTLSDPDAFKVLSGKRVLLEGY